MNIDYDAYTIYKRAKELRQIKYTKDLYVFKERIATEVFNGNYKMWLGESAWNFNGYSLLDIPEVRKFMCDNNIVYHFGGDDDYYLYLSWDKADIEEINTYKEFTKKSFFYKLIHFYKYITLCPIYNLIEM